MSIPPKSRKFYCSTRRYEKPRSLACCRETGVNQSRRLSFHRRMKFLSTTSLSTVGDTWPHIKFQSTLNFAASYHERFLAKHSIGSCARKNKEEEERLHTQHLRAS